MLHVAIAGIFLLMVLAPCVVAFRFGRDREDLSLDRASLLQEPPHESVQSETLQPETLQPGTVQPVQPSPQHPLSPVTALLHQTHELALDALQSVKDLMARDRSSAEGEPSLLADAEARKSHTEALAALVRATAARADTAADAAEDAERAFAAARENARWAIEEALLAQDAYLQDALRGEHLQAADLVTRDSLSGASPLNNSLHALEPAEVHRAA